MPQGQSLPAQSSPDEARESLTMPTSPPLRLDSIERQFPRPPTHYLQKKDYQSTGRRHAETGGAGDHWDGSPRPFDHAALLTPRAPMRTILSEQQLW